MTWFQSEKYCFNFWNQYKILVYFNLQKSSPGSDLLAGLILEPEPGPSPTLIFEARFKAESQIYRLSQDMRNCVISKILVYGYSCR